MEKTQIQENFKGSSWNKVDETKFTPSPVIKNK
jgi:hypothetical protein